MITKTQIASFALAVTELNKLQSADEVAVFLRGEEIKGNKHPWSCPVTNYIRKQIPELKLMFYTVLTIPTCVQLIDNGLQAEFPLSPGPNDFIHAFDTGSYADLYVR